MDSSKDSMLSSRIEKLAALIAEKLISNDEFINMLVEKICSRPLYNPTARFKKIAINNKLFQTKHNQTSPSAASVSIAIRLASILMKHKLVVRRPNIRSWAAEIEKFIKSSDVEIQRIEKLLEWYGNNITDKFVPKAHSAKSFCAKFARIESAMKRSYEDSQQSEEDRQRPQRQIEQSLEYRI